MAKTKKDKFDLEAAKKTQELGNTKKKMSKGAFKPGIQGPK